MAARKTQIQVEADPSGVLDMLRTFRFRLPDIGDAIAAELGEQAKDDLKRELVAQGSDVTGQGKQSIQSVQTKRGSRRVVGNGYLIVVDQGGPPRDADTENNRFQVWARQHGFTVDELAQIIADKGTNEHPFIDQAVRRTRKTSRQKAVKVLKRRL